MASGLGVLVLLLMGLIQGVISFGMISQSASSDPDTLAPLVLLSSGLGSLICLCGSVLNVVVGGLYGLWAGRASQGGDDGVIGGAASAATAQALGTMIQTGISLMATPFMLEYSGAPVSPGADPAVLGFSLLTTGVGSLLSVCGSTVIGAVLGALGGLLGSVVGRRV